MVIDDSKDSITYTDILNEDIERKLNKVNVYKKFISYINNFETSFDKNSSSFTGDYNPYYEDYLRKKKSNIISIVDTIKLDDKEIVQDLNEIDNDGGVQVRILDSALYIKTEKFSKHDRVLVKIDKDEYMGSVTCVDTQDIVIKSRDGRRNRIRIDDIKQEKVEILKYQK